MFADADEASPPPSPMEFAADMAAAIERETDEATRAMLRQLRDGAIARASIPPPSPRRVPMRRRSRAGWVN